MNPLDLVAILLVVLAVILGFQSGALPQVGGLLGALAGGAVAVLALPHLVEPLDAVPIGIRPYVVLAGLLMTVGIGESVGSAIGRTAARSLGTGFLGAADRLAGSLTGAAQALLVVWLAGGLLALGPVPRLSEAAQTSTAVRTLNAVLPPPTEIAGELGQLIGNSGLPDVFVGFEPLPRPPVDRPTDHCRPRDRLTRRGQHRPGACRRLRRAGVGQRCGRSGTATSSRTRMSSPVPGTVRWRSRRRTVGPPRHTSCCSTHPSTSLCSGRPDLHARPLRFANSDPGRGSVGAALGYPGGGPLMIVPAAVTGSYRATGRDIYDEARVDRDILELRAQIDRGDSGGPFVLQDGTIGGLVFAEARSDPDVGYALTPTSVAVRVTPAVGRREVVATGDCLR